MTRITWDSKEKSVLGADVQPHSATTESTINRSARIIGNLSPMLTAALLMQGARRRLGNATRSVDHADPFVYWARPPNASADSCRSPNVIAQFSARVITACDGAVGDFAMLARQIAITSMLDLEYARDIGRSGCAIPHKNARGAAYASGEQRHVIFAVSMFPDLEWFEIVGVVEAAVEPMQWPHHITFPLDISIRDRSG
jgi:hypothetical protein